MDKNIPHPEYERSRDTTMLEPLYFFETEEVQPHFHHQMEILIVEKGSYKVSINGKTETVFKGGICLADSYDVHSYERIEPQSVGKVFIFPKTFIPDYNNATQSLVLTNNFLFDESVFQQIYALVNVYKANHIKCHNTTFQRGIISTIMGILSMSLEYTKKDFSDQPYVMRDILQYIHDHFKEDLTLSIVSKKFGYSPNHFSTLFNTFMGRGLKDYINFIRVEHSAQALIAGKSILEAGFESGFDSVRTFYRTFTKHYGVSPKQYTKK